MDAPHVVHEDKRRYAANGMKLLSYILTLSIYTLMVFLNDDFTGGMTNFLPLNYDDKVECFLTALRNCSMDTIKSFSQDCTLGMNIPFHRNGITIRIVWHSQRNVEEEDQCVLLHYAGV